MAFPSDVLGTRVELKINGVWTNTVRYDSVTRIIQKQGVSIKRGASGLQDRTPAGSAMWHWQDPNGVYNNENPRSPYFNLLPRNTPVRVAVPRTTSALYILDRNDGSRAQTTDKAALDIVGDIELRFDIEPRRWTRWASGQNRAFIVASKYNDTVERSWYVRIGEPSATNSVGQLSFIWSTTGVNSVVANCNAPVPTTGRISIKITLDIDNGAAAREVKFWTSTTGINGTYTQLGTTVTGAVTSVFSGAANVELGTMNGGMPQDLVTSFTKNYNGRIHAFQLWNGISGSGGTMVANADFTAQATGATSFADGLGNTWTLGGTAEITNADYRFYGELSAPVLKPKKSNNGTGVVVTVEAEAGGLLRRLGINETPLQSPIYLEFSGRYVMNGWWTGESSNTNDTPTVSSGITGGSPATISDITFVDSDLTLAGSDGVMKCGNTAPQFVGNCNAVTLTNETHFIGYFKFPALPGAEIVMFSMYSETGTVRRWDWTVDATSYRLRGYDVTNTQIVTKATLFGTGAEPTNWIAYHMQLTNAAGTISIKSEWMNIATGITFTSNGVGTLTYAGSNGTISKIVVQAAGTSLADVRFAHLMSSSQVGLVFWDGTNPTFGKFSSGWVGETAGARFTRICQLLVIESGIIGYESSSQAMGPQPIDTALNILYECAECDGGKIMEANDRLALEFRPVRSLYNQYGMSLTWAQLAEGIEGTPDDTDVANDIILTRLAGGTARATVLFGPMSVLAPPNGINPVPDGPTVNCSTLDQLTQLVGAMLIKRAWPGQRYPALVVKMHHPTFAASTTRFLDALQTEISNIIRVTALPTFMAPDELALIASGITETIYGQEYTLEWALNPYGPFQTSENQDISTADIYSNYVAAHTVVNGVVQQQLNAAINNSTTSVVVKTLSGPLFVTGAVNFRIEVGGETMTVSNITGATSPQTLTVTRGVIGGYAAAHPINDYVYITPELLVRL